MCCNDPLKSHFKTDAERVLEVRQLLRGGLLALLGTNASTKGVTTKIKFRIVFLTCSPIRN